MPLDERQFEAFVVSPIQADAEWTGRTNPLPRCDFDIDCYGALSCIEVVVPGRQGTFIFIRLLSGREPFDTVQFAEVETIMVLECLARDESQAPRVINEALITRGIPSVRGCQRIAD